MSTDSEREQVEREVRDELAAQWHLRGAAYLPPRQADLYAKLVDARLKLRTAERALQLVERDLFARPKPGLSYYTEMAVEDALAEIRR